MISLGPLKATTSLSPIVRIDGLSHIISSPTAAGQESDSLREILQEWANKAGANRVMASDPVSLYYVDC